MANPASAFCSAPPGTPRPEWHWIPVSPGDERFIALPVAALGITRIRAWVEGSIGAGHFSRSGCRGLITALVECHGQELALVWSDFRTDGAAFGHATSSRLVAFLRALRRETSPRTPLVYVANSSGVSLMEGRTAFSDAFAIWPELLALSAERLVITCATGTCLGLAPLLFGLGHYRLAVAGSTRINLTGPEVLRLFFGPDAEFETRAAAERLWCQTDLVHEVSPSLEAALRTAGEVALNRRPTVASDLGSRSAAILGAAFDPHPRELFAGWCPELRVFVASRDGRKVGCFLNPPERSNNMITVRALDLYAAALDLFKAMRIPIVSLLDSPGIDPRFAQSDANNIRRILAVGERIIRYPHGKLGVIVGRCFGGAATLGFPKVFNGGTVLALRDSRMGTMDRAIVRRVLAGSPRLLARWEAAASRETDDYADLRADGALDRVIGLDDLAGEVRDFLCSVQPAGPVLRLARA